MDSGLAIDLVRHAITLVLILAAPVLLIGLATGLVVSLMQSVTQVHDLTLSFVPRIIAMLVALMIFGPWMISRMVEYGAEMFSAAQ